MTTESKIHLLVLAALTALLALSCEPTNGDETPDEDVDETFGTEYEEFRLTNVAGPFAHGWGMAHLSEGRILVTERDGRLLLVDGDRVDEVDGLPDIAAQSQGGLLDVSVHPDFEETGEVYLTYSTADDDGETATALSRGVLDGGSLVDVDEIFVQDRYSSPGRHYGSRIAWMDDGTLLMSIGDRGSEPMRAQDLDDHAGSIVRLEDDGSVPGDNPFVEDDDAHDEIYAYGLRNVQGMVVDGETDRIWVTDHGPRGGDELNLVEAGENYGWPVVTLGLDYGTEEVPDYAQGRRMEGMVDPVHEFSPTFAPSGLALVTGDEFPAWRGNLLAGGLRAERIRRVVVDEYDGEMEMLHEEELLLREIGRIRDVSQGPDGAIYVLNDESNGGLFRVASSD